MALMDFSLDDLDAEISGDARFLFPVLLPLIFAVHFEDNHFNEHRPHQALWNFTPGYVHRTGNKTVLYAQYKKQVQIAKEQRIAFNRSQMSQLGGVSN